MHRIALQMIVASFECWLGGPTFAALYPVTAAAAAAVQAMQLVSTAVRGTADISLKSASVKQQH
jgi:hypothetical protein